MKQLIGLIRLGALTTASVVLCRGRRETPSAKTPDRQLPQRSELVLLGIDGTVIAHEINLASTYWAGREPFHARKRGATEGPACIEQIFFGQKSDTLTGRQGYRSWRE
jgi:hypothetical protein